MPTPGDVVIVSGVLPGIFMVSLGRLIWPLRIDM